MKETAEKRSKRPPRIPKTIIKQFEVTGFQVACELPVYANCEREASRKISNSEKFV